MTIAALYVATDGCYFGLPGVDPWDEARDARLYDGPHPVVAHPPCQRWGRYWHGGPSAKVRRVKGDDGGCFAAALASVRQWGGVLEHPEASAAWATFGLIAPPKSGGWVTAGDWLGWTCCVEQGHYGHRARKATWLYAVGVTSLPALKWGRSNAKVRLDQGYHSAEERRIGSHGARRPPLGRFKEWADDYEAASGKAWFDRLSPKERLATPEPFRDLLRSIAASVRFAPKRTD